jgi:flagellar motility protein MotE (MotC chaperone)
VKFLLVPLLIIGMFVSFTAAMLAMLFFTETVKSPEELQSMLSGGDSDPSRLDQSFVDEEDKLGQLASLLETYRGEYETKQDSLEEQLDRLALLQSSLAARATELDEQEARIGMVADSALGARRTERIAELATFYNKLKPAPAAEILQTGTLDDTTVGLLMRQLQAQHMAKIMASMDPEFAARITNLMKELE